MPTFLSHQLRHSIQTDLTILTSVCPMIIFSVLPRTVYLRGAHATRNQSCLNIILVDHQQLDQISSKEIAFQPINDQPNQLANATNDTPMVQTLTAA